MTTTPTDPPVSTPALTEQQLAELKPLAAIIETAIAETPMATPVMPDSTAEWIRLNALPPLWRHPDGIDELRVCLCQAPPSDWLGGIDEPAARLWNRDGRTVAWGQAGEDTKFLGPRHLVEFWHTDRVCRRRTSPSV